MELYGTFTDYTGTKYRLDITTGTGIPTEIIDPTENAYDAHTDRNQIFFGTDPVHIRCERSDLTQLIMISQATIRLVVNNDMSRDLFANTNRDIKVIIRKDYGTINESIVFFGYVDPLQFDQGFANKYEEITITATDPLGALESITIDQTEIEQGEILSVISMISKIFNKAFENKMQKSNLPAYRGILTYFPEEINPNSIKVNAAVFYGEDQDDYMNLYDALNELLKYLGCTVAYEPNGRYIHLYNMYSHQSNIEIHNTWFDGKDDSLDASTSISMDDTYSQVTLTCEIEPVEDEIKLIDNDLQYSDYPNYQKYMTELVSLGEGKSAYDGFKELLNSPDNEESTEYDGGYTLSHYCYVMRNDAWKFGKNSYITAMGGTEGDAIMPMKGDQSDVLIWLKNNPMKAAFVQFGKGTKLQRTDNSPINNINMSDYFIVSINGHDDHSAEGGHHLTLLNQMQANSPLCTYTGLQSLNLNPTDPNVTNYIVISGKITLNPLQPKTGWHWDNEYEKSENKYNETKYALANGSLFGCTIPHESADDGVYYQQKWWKCTDPRNPSYTFRGDTTGLSGFLENNKLERLQYTYTSYSGYSGDETDRISKLPIFACQLKIGDKYCVERLDKGPSGQGVFEWMTMEEWEASDLYKKGYGIPYFTIGIDPKKDDKIVGRAYNIQNNVNYGMNINGTGTSIPIKMSDKINGVPEFTILCPIDSNWNEIERIHPTLFRHTSWEDHKYWVLETLQSILVSDFKIEFQSNNAMYNKDMSNKDNDLVYYSDVNPIYLEKLEEDIKICTPLTIDECIEKGVKYQISNSYVLEYNDDPFYGWEYGNDKVKPEHLYIDYYYKQYYKPARIVDVNVNGGYVFGNATSQTNSFIGVSTILSKYIIDMEFPGIKNPDPQSEDDFYNYYVMSIDWSLKNKDTNMKMREMLDYEYPFS